MELVDLANVMRFSQLNGVDVEVEMDLFMFPGVIGPRGERPSLSFVLLVVDTVTGDVLGFELLQAVKGLDEMWREVP